MGRKPELLLVSLLLVLAIAAVFVQVRTHSLLEYGDARELTRNDIVQKGSLGGAFEDKEGWAPLSTISHIAAWKAFGANAAAHKFVNVALHAGATIFLLLFLVRATGMLWPSAIVAALFALHPTRVEPVAWVADRKEVLGGFFFMLTLWLYAGYVQRDRNAGRLVLVVLAGAACMFSNPLLLTLPFVLLLVDYWPLERLRNATADLKPLLIEKIALFAMLYPVLVLTLGTKERVDFGFGAAVTRITGYLGTLVWPSGLAIHYPEKPTDTLTMLLALVVIGAMLFAARFHRYIATGVLWYVGTLLPTLERTGDRFTYIPYVGLFIAIVFWLRDLTATQRIEWKAALAVVLIAIFGAVSFNQTAHWRDSETVFRHALDVTKRNSLAHLNLGYALLERGDAAEATIHFRTVNEIDPNNQLAQQGLGRALLASGDTKRIEEAAPLLAKVASAEGKPQAAAEAAVARGDWKEAVAKYAEALVLEPSDAQLRNNYAAALARTGNDAEALKQYGEAIRLRADHFDARMNAAALLSRLNRQDEAIQHLAAAARLRPSSPEPNVYLALIYTNQKKFAEAIQQIDVARARDAAAANRIFTNAVRMEFADTNLEQYKVFLMGRIAAAASAGGKNE